MDATVFGSSLLLSTFVLNDASNKMSLMNDDCIIRE